MRRSEAFWGLVLILAGAVFLVGTLTDINVWGFLWPVFLILFGAWILWGTLRGREAVAGEDVVIPFEAAEEVRVKIHYGAGRLNVHGDAGPGVLLAGNFGGGLDHKLRREDGKLRLTLRSPQGSVWIWPWWAPGERDWSFGLSNDVPLYLDVETGASEALLSLTELNVKSLRLSAGASSVRVRLPARADQTPVKVEAGAASVSLRVPEGVAARIHTESGLASISVDRGRFPRAGGYYQSPDFETAENRLEIRIEAGVGSVEIR